jgi:hypothetical protein
MAEDGPGERGPSMFDVAALPDPERELVTWLVRQGPALEADMVAFTGLGTEGLAAMAKDLVSRGYLDEAQTAAGTEYRARIGSRKTARVARGLLESFED